MTIRKALTEEERGQSRRLVIEEYSALGYIGSKTKALSSSKFYDGPTGTRLLAVEEGSNKVLGTIAFVLDSPALLPMDTLYHEELEILRKKGLCLSEVGQFAITKGIGTYTRLSIVKKLFNSLLLEFKAQAVDSIVITVNPKHDMAYTYLGFSTFAKEKPYPELTNARAVAKIRSLHPPKDLKLNDVISVVKNGTNIL